MEDGKIGGPPLNRNANSPAFLDLLQSLVNLFQTHYKNVDSEKMEEWYGDHASRLANWPPQADSDPNVRVLRAYKDASLRLQDHSAMLHLFEEACGKTRVGAAGADPKSYDWIPNDKIEDQFRGMSELKSRLPTGRSSSASGSKRSSAASEEQPSKRRKATGGSRKGA